MKGEVYGIDEVHPLFGVVVGMGCGGSIGEPYRWLLNKEGTVSMIPLSALQNKEKKQDEG